MAVPVPVVGQVGGINVTRILAVLEDALDLIVEFANEPGVAWRAKAYPLRNGEKVVLLEKLGPAEEWAES